MAFSSYLTITTIAITITRTVTNASGAIII